MIGEGPLVAPVLERLQDDCEPDAVFYFGTKSIRGRKVVRIDLGKPAEAAAILRDWHGARALVIGSIAFDHQKMPADAAKIYFVSKNEEKLGAYSVVKDILHRAGVETVLLKDVLEECLFGPGHCLGRPPTPEELSMVEPVRKMARSSQTERGAYLFGVGQAPVSLVGDPAAAMRALSAVEGCYAYLCAAPVHDGLAGSPVVTSELIDAAFNARLTGVFVETRSNALLLAPPTGLRQREALDSKLFFHGL